MSILDVPEAMEDLQAMGAYNSSLEHNEQYYTHPQSLARAAILSDTTDAGGFLSESTCRE